MSDRTPTAPTPEPIAQERRVVTEIPGPQSRALHARRLEVVPPGVHSALPVYIDRAHDSILVDVDGNQFIDCGGGIGVTTVGHTDDTVVAAATAALQRMTHTLFTVTPYESYVRVAELLAARFPGVGPARTLLVNSGAEAVENGVKIARKFTGRPGVAVLEHAYHGRTMLTATMNHKAAPYALGFGPRAGDVYRAPNSYPLRDGLSGAEAAARTISFLEKTAGAEDLACLVVEPIQGEGGFLVPAEGYLPALAAWCRANGIVFIADEVQSGIARTGTFYAIEHFGVEPDLVLSAKGIAGGLPLAAVTGRADIMDRAMPGGLGGTFGGNPVSCAAAIAVFERIERADLLVEARRIEGTLGAGLRALQAKYPEVIAEVRGRGAMLAIELVRPGGLEVNPELATHIIDFAAQHGVLLLNCGIFGNVVRLLPSLKLSDALAADVVAVIDQALAAA
ncbi:MULTISPECIES: aminotransferase class III-fold pyridoxal phosphate-dependent enzyme [unclassified Leucobacter]|uniref:aminotransferase class III-fold pyridoxal phosphate-dependent enzyme n=1 Tax=unclassified Leucobacter TaxID=2621730 RepID=UPI00165E6FE2|nr:MULTISPECIES: aminotransferase class III-fold pyridoxal phosphate-dependent enzyme [unclassified Leucobacter]MBC9935754.1 aminotransferase class III-fold pyridoxal phosphate-dependent enzyme [Leucobacter sp. cx-87]